MVYSTLRFFNVTRNKAELSVSIGAVSAGYINQSVNNSELMIQLADACERTATATRQLLTWAAPTVRGAPIWAANNYSTVIFAMVLLVFCKMGAACKTTHTLDSIAVVPNHEMQLLQAPHKRTADGMIYLRSVPHREDGGLVV